MRRLALTVFGLLLGFGLTVGHASAQEGNLAIGTVKERGPGVRGHGQVLRQAIGYELSRSGAFTLVADDEAKKQAIQRIHQTNRQGIDEAQWVELGQAVGATHLLMGEVQQQKNTCSAFVQLVHLQTRKTRVTRPEYYDCTRYDLVELAGDLSEQLTGKRATAKQSRQHRRPPERPVNIVMDQDHAKVDGVDYKLPARRDAGLPAVPPSTSKATRHTTQPSLPRTDAEPAPRRSAERTPRATPKKPALPASNLDLERWPALQPYYDDSGEPVFNLYALACLLKTKAMLTAGLVLAWPLFFVFVGAFLVRSKERAGTMWLRFGFSMSVLAAAVTLACWLLFRYGLGRPLSEDVTLVLVSAPGAGLALWLIIGRMVGVLTRLRLLHQIGWFILLTAGMAALLLIATQVQVHVAAFALTFLVAWLGFRVAVRLKRKRA